MPEQTSFNSVPSHFSMPWIFTWSPYFHNTHSPAPDLMYLPGQRQASKLGDVGFLPPADTAPAAHGAAPAPRRAHPAPKAKRRPGEGGVRAAGLPGRGEPARRCPGQEATRGGGRVPQCAEPRTLREHPEQPPELPGGGLGSRVSCTRTGGPAPAHTAGLTRHTFSPLRGRSRGRGPVGAGTLRGPGTGGPRAPYLRSQALLLVVLAAQDPPQLLHGSAPGRSGGHSVARRSRTRRQPEPATPPGNRKCGSPVSGQAPAAAVAARACAPGPAGLPGSEQSPAEPGRRVPRCAGSWPAGGVAVVTQECRAAASHRGSNCSSVPSPAVRTAGAQPLLVG